MQKKKTDEKKKKKKKRKEQDTKNTIANAERRAGEKRKFIEIFFAGYNLIISDLEIKPLFPLR